MTIQEIKKVCFIGSGTMGCFNSLVTSIFGYDCALFDISETALEQAPARQREIGEMAMQRNELLTQEVIDESLGRIIYTSNLEEAVKDADLLSESVPEKLVLKRSVHKELDAVCPSETILTTNTSTFLVSEIEDVVQRGDKFAALHFHLGGSLLDIVGGPRTSAKTVDILKRFSKSIMQTPIVMKKEKDGYIFNSIFTTMLKTAVILVLDGYADYMDVDRAYMAATGNRTGPFGMMDGVGLNVCLDVMDDQANRKGDNDSKRMANFLRPFVDQGELGRKTGKGFYTYPNPIFAQKEFLS
jgi:enoyl-CoA hydratase / 3-hydroxyacyl-CoA dehydrogenase